MCVSEYVGVNHSNVLKFVFQPANISFVIKWLQDVFLMKVLHFFFITFLVFQPTASLPFSRTACDVCVKCSVKTDSAVDGNKTHVNQ